MSFCVFSIHECRVVVSGIVLRSHCIVIKVVTRGGYARGFHFLSFLALFVVASSRVMGGGFLARVFIVASGVSRVLRGVELLANLPR